MEIDYKKKEWLEADGLGGFAMGTASGMRTRRYHAVLLRDLGGGAGMRRIVFVNGFDASVRTLSREYALTSQVYAPGVLSPDGARRIESFTSDPWPIWAYQLEDGTRVRHHLFVLHEAGVTVLRWRRIEGAGPATLAVRLFLSGRDYHHLHRENAAFDFSAQIEGNRVRWRPYPDVPSIIAVSNGDYSHGPYWYRGFHYEADRERGLDHTEDLGAPGVFRFDLARGDAVLVLGLEGEGGIGDHADMVEAVDDMERAERERRERLGGQLEHMADSFIVRHGRGKTVVAGYPWFEDWGRDTFVALRGMCLTTGRIGASGEVLREWARYLSEGMLPNYVRDRNAVYNSVDASLWYVVAAGEYLALAGNDETIRKAIIEVLEHYERGTRHGIRADHDGLLYAGASGVQLTWMDAKIGDWVVTPRRGKPVEVQALWVNALLVGKRLVGRWSTLIEKARASFAERFWNESRQCLYDVVDVEFERGVCDGTLRPNQIFAVGGLPEPLLKGQRARAVVDTVERELWTPLGLRSLAPGEPGYRGRYEGGPAERDAAYHQGTAWPWLLGTFVDAWLGVRGYSPDAKAEARARFLAPLIAHLDEAGLGGVSEIADGDPPHTPRGCPFQAWSVGELLRIRKMLE